jgi:predicted phosphodiesterase
MDSIIQENINKAYVSAPEVEIRSSDKFLILSDFHIGGRRRRDEFRKNAPLVLKALKDWYLPGGYKLILNGDIEELHRVRLKRISHAWQELYALFRDFKHGPGLYKIIGNHDHGAHHYWKTGRTTEEKEVNADILPALKLLYKGNPIFILHGHQASLYNSPFRHKMNKAVLRFIAHPLHINNIKRDHLSNRPLKAEQRLFEYSRQMGIVTVAGHTHRALFEGHSEEEYLKFRLETMIRDYMKKKDSDESEVLKHAIKDTAATLLSVLENEDYKSHGSIYDPLALPCLFNSGTVIHHFGATGIEIARDKISLTAWYESRNPRSRIFHYEKSSVPFQEMPWIRKAVLKSDSLDYIFTRIALLTKE